MGERRFVGSEVPPELFNLMAQRRDKVGVGFATQIRMALAQYYGVEMDKPKN